MFPSVDVWNNENLNGLSPKLVLYITPYRWRSEVPTGGNGYGKAGELFQFEDFFDPLYKFLMRPYMNLHSEFTDVR